MLEWDHIEYEDLQLQQMIHWLYGQYKYMFKYMRRNMGKDIYIKQVLPELQHDLSDIDPCYNSIVVLVDIIDMVVDSPIISKLFILGQCHTFVTKYISKRKVQGTFLCS